MDLKKVCDVKTSRMFLSLLCVSLMLLVVEVKAAASSEKVLFQKNSLYQFIEVKEDSEKGERYVLNNRKDVLQGGISLGRPDKLLFEYTQVAFISLAFLDREPKSVLFIGLGAGSMPRYFNRYYPGVESDAVEIDPDMAEVAKKYFYFRENERMKAHVGDGRVFIKRTQKKYDIIFLDAYQSGDIPFHLTTLEFLKEVKGKLKEGGIVVSNILSPFKNKFFDSMVATYDRAFPHFFVFKGRRSNNFVFVATDSGLVKDREGLAEKARKVQAAKKLDIDLAEISAALEHGEEYRIEAKVLTDDFAPVNLYQHMKSK